MRVVPDSESEHGSWQGTSTRFGRRRDVSAITRRDWVVQFEVNQGDRIGVALLKSSVRIRCSAEIDDVEAELGDVR